MTMRYFDCSGYPDGYLFEQNRKNKGISRLTLQPLLDRVVIEQTAEPRALDWHSPEPGDRQYRWSGPNPRPKILIPYTGSRARLSIEVIAKNPDVRVEELSLAVESRQVDSKTEFDTTGIFHLVTEIDLQSSDYTVLTVNAPTFRPCEHGLNGDSRRVGIAVGDIFIAPIA